MPQGGSQNTSSTTVAEPWAGVQPFLTGAYETAQNIFKNGPPGYYPGQTLGGPSNYTQTAIGLQAERGLHGSPMVGAAQQGIGQIAGGQSTQGFAGAADASNGTITGAQLNPNIRQFQQQAGVLAPGLTDLGAWNPNAAGADQAGGYYRSLMGGNGAFATPGLTGQAQTTAGWLLGGQMNPATQQAVGAAQTLGAYGAGGGLGLSGGTATAADNSLRGQLQGGNAFAGVVPGATGAIGTLTGQNAAGSLMGGGGQAIQGLMGANASGGLYGGSSGAINGMLGSNAAGGLVPTLQQTYGNIASGGGDFVNGAMTQAGQQGLLGYAQGQNVGGSAGSRAAGQGLLTDTLQGQYVGSGNPYFRGMVDAATRPMVENFQRNVVPAIQSAASSAGRYGSGAMSDALANAGQDLNRQIGDIGSQLAYQTYGMERGLQNAGIGTALQDYLSQQGLQMQGLGQIQGGANAGIGNQLAAAAGIAGLRGQDIGAQGQGIGAYAQLRGQDLGAQGQGLSALTNWRGQDLSALGQGAQLGGQLYQAGEGQGLNAAQAAFNAAAQQGALSNNANTSLLNSYYTGTGQQLQGLNSLIGAGQFDRTLGLQGAQAATQGALGFGGQQLQSIGMGLNNALNTGNQALNAASLGSQNYLGAERNQIGAAQTVPSLAQQDYLDINQLGAAGTQLDQWNQAQINSDIDRWNYNTTAPLNYTSNYISLLNSAPWSSSSTGQVPGPSGFQNAVGTAGSLAQIAGAVLPFIVPCWVAREVYGPMNPKWMRFRDFLLTQAPATFRNWYIANGERLAAWLREHPEHKPAVRAGMDAVIGAAA